MFFDHPTQIPALALTANLTIFVVPDPLTTAAELSAQISAHRSAPQAVSAAPLSSPSAASPNSAPQAASAQTSAPQTPLAPPLLITPDQNSKVGGITIDQLRNLEPLIAQQSLREQLIIFAPAEALLEAAANVFLKNFEEPPPFLHYLLLTKNAALLLPTIRSRAQIFRQKQPNYLSAPVTAPPAVHHLARQLVAAAPADLPELAEQLVKQKEPRRMAIQVAATAVEILYKSYFATQKKYFLQRLPAFLTLYDNLERSGHLKLHLIADLI